MNKDIVQQLINLGITLLITFIIWSYYGRQTFAPTKRYSTFWPRFWTGSVDSCVLWPLGFITTILFSLEIPRAVAALLAIVENLAWLLYTVVMHARYGQTIGKMVTKVRVVDFRTERSISWRQAWLREGIPMVLSLGFLGWQIFFILTGNLSADAVANRRGLAQSKGFWLVMALPTLWFVAEVLTMLTNERRRAVHDFIAGTVVVRTNIEGHTAQQSAPPNGNPTPSLASPTIREGPTPMS